MSKIDDEEEKYIKLSANDISVLKKITPDDRYSELKKVKEIDNIIKDLKIYNDKIGEKCSKFLNKIADEKEFKKSKLISNCKEIKDAINNKIKEEKKKLKSQKPMRGKGGKTPAVKKTDIKEKDIPNAFWELLKQFGITPSTIKAGAMTAIGYLYSQYQQGNITTAGIRDWVNRNTSRLFGRDDRGGGSGGSSVLEQMAANQVRQRANLNIRANTQALEGMMHDATMANVIGGNVPANSASNLINSAIGFGGMSLTGLGGISSVYHGVNWMRNRFNQPYRPPGNMGIPREAPDVFQDAPEIDPTLQMPDLNVPDMPEVPERDPQERIDERRGDLLDEEAVEEDQDLENRQMEDRQNEVNRQIDDMDAHGNAWGVLFSGMSSGSNKMAESSHVLAGLLGRAFALQQEHQQIEQHIDEPLINIMPLYTDEQVEQRRRFQDSITGIQEQLAIQDEPQREELDEAVSEDILHDTMKEMIIEDLIDANVDLQKQEEVDMFLAQLISNVDQDVEHKEILTENINKIVNDLVGEIVREDKKKSGDEKDLTDEEKKILKEEEKLIQEETLKIMKKVSPDVNEEQVIGMMDGMMDAILENNKDITDEELDGIMDSVMNKILEDTKKPTKKILEETQGDIMEQIRRRIIASPPPEPLIISPPEEEQPPTSPYREFRQRILSPVIEEESDDIKSSPSQEASMSLIGSPPPDDLMEYLTQSGEFSPEELKQIQEEIRTEEDTNEGREAVLSLVGDIIDEAVDESEAKPKEESTDTEMSSFEDTDTDTDEEEDDKYKLIQKYIDSDIDFRNTKIKKIIKILNEWVNNLDWEDENTPISMNPSDMNPEIRSIIDELKKLFVKGSIYIDNNLLTDEGMNWIHNNLGMYYLENQDTLMNLTIRLVKELDIRRRGYNAETKLEIERRLNELNLSSKQIRLFELLIEDYLSLIRGLVDKEDTRFPW